VGLGLSVSLGIVKAHGGELTAQNRPADAGGGARFTMRIPFDGASAPLVPGFEAAAGADTGTTPVPPARTAVREDASQPRSLPERRRTILIIDDEAAIRQGLKRYFIRKGWIVEESPDGADALAKLLRPEASRIYEVVLCDLKMPGVSGMDVFDRVVSAAPGVSRRFILSTGDTSAPDVSGFLSQVTVPILEKPFELTELEALAERVRSGAAPGGDAGDRGPA
jgi:CheY-like chemotaxis protein